MLNDGADTGWARYGGNFSLAEGRYLLNDAGACGKALTGDAFWTDGTLDADVLLSSPGNAGLVFRMTNPDYNGPDAGYGYYAGLDAGGSLIFGLQSNGWSALASAPMPVPTNVWHHLRVTMSGDLLRIYANDLTTPKINWRGTNFHRGQIGVRAFRSNAQFDNVTFSNAVPLRLQLRLSGDELQCSWPETSTGVKLWALPDAVAPGGGAALTNLPRLTNGRWEMSLEPSAARQYFLLRAE